MFLVLAGGVFISSFIFCVAFYVIGFKISYEFKWRYFKAILQQDVEWYETQSINELPTEFHSNLAEIAGSTGRTTAFIIYSISSLITGVGVALMVGTVFTFAVLICIPYTL